MNKQRLLGWGLVVLIELTMACAPSKTPSEVKKAGIGNQITGVFEQEEGDGVVYVPNRTAVLQPPSSFTSDSSLIPDSTFDYRFHVGLPKEGEERPADSAMVFVPVQRHGEVAVGYIPRRIIFFSVQNTVSHSLEGDTPTVLRTDYHIEYNNLVVEVGGHRTVIDGGYLARYFTQPDYRAFEPFGLDACEFGDFNSDGNLDLRIRYETIPSLSYFGLAGGPSYFYLTLISGKLLPMFAFDEISGEDIGLVKSRVAFRGPWWSAKKDVIEQLIAESSDTAFEASVRTYRQKNHYYLPSASKELFKLSLPWTTKLTKATDLYDWPGGKPAASLGSGSETKIVEGSMVLPGEPEPGFWFKVASPEGWIKGQDLGLPES